MRELLVASEISVTFGSLRAVDRLSLSVEAGRLVGLIGPNGAGKTTLVDAITGFTPHEGRLVFDGRALDGASPHQRARAGLARTWQSVELFDDLTVAENLDAVAHRQSARSLLLDLVRPRRSQDRTAVEYALEAVGASDLADRQPRELSHGQRMLVGVARALADIAALDLHGRAGGRARYRRERHPRAAAARHRRPRHFNPAHRSRHGPRPQLVR